jgi:hypothetical protein
VTAHFSGVREFLGQEKIVNCKQWVYKNQSTLHEPKSSFLKTTRKYALALITLIRQIWSTGCTNTRLRLPISIQLDTLIRL